MGEADVVPIGVFGVLACGVVGTGAGASGAAGAGCAVGAAGAGTGRTVICAAGGAPSSWLTQSVTISGSIATYAPPPMMARSRIQRTGRPPDFFGDFMGEDERVFVVCSNSSSVNSKSGSGWRAKNNVESVLPANDGPPATANIGHLPVAIIGTRAYSVKVLITKVPESQFCGVNSTRRTRRRKLVCMRQQGRFREQDST